jgi:DNA-binding transcriptional MerR regulator
MTSGDIVHITGIKYSRLNYWVKIGLINPSINKSIGSGNDNEFSFNDLLCVEIARQLSELGISIHFIRESIKNIRYLETITIGNNIRSEITININVYKVMERMEWFCINFGISY